MNVHRHFSLIFAASLFNDHSGRENLVLFDIKIKIKSEKNPAKHFTKKSIFLQGRGHELHILNTIKGIDLLNTFIIVSLEVSNRGLSGPASQIAKTN